MTSEGAPRVDEPTIVVAYARFSLLFVATCRHTCHVKVTLIFFAQKHALYANIA